MELTQEYFDQQLKRLSTKEDLTALEQRMDAKFATKDDLLELATKQDLNSLKSDVAEIKTIVARIDKRTDEDTRAALKDIAKLQKRVTRVERALKLQPE